MSSPIIKIKEAIFIISRFVEDISFVIIILTAHINGDSGTQL